MTRWWFCRRSQLILSKQWPKAPFDMGHAVNNRLRFRRTFVGFLRSGKRLSIIVGIGELGSFRISEGVVWWKQELVCVPIQMVSKGRLLEV